MDAHRIHVLHIAHGDAVITRITHDLVLDFLPSAKALLNEHLLCASVERVMQGFIQLFGCVRDATTFAAQGESKPKHDRHPDLTCRLAGFRDRATCPCPWPF